MPYSLDFGDRRTFLLQLEPFARSEAAAKDSQVGAAYCGLLARADEAFERPSSSVVDKGSGPPSGCLHDYMSIAPYLDVRRNEKLAPLPLKREKQMTSGMPEFPAQMLAVQGEDMRQPDEVAAMVRLHELGW